SNRHVRYRVSTVRKMKTIIMRRASLARLAMPLVALALIQVTGCGSGPGGELAPDRFYRPQPPGTDESRHVLADRPEPAMYNQLQVHPFGRRASLVSELEDGRNADVPAPQQVTEVSRASSELAEATGRLPAATQPSTSASTRVTAVRGAEREVVQPGFAGAGGLYRTI